MDFSPSPSLEKVRQVFRRIAQKFPEPYWRSSSEAQRFPVECWKHLGAGGWFGIAVPRAFKGKGLGVSGLAGALEQFAETGAGLGSYLLLSNAAIAWALSKHGTPDLKARLLPGLMKGDLAAALALTEGEAGSDALSIRMKVAKQAGQYLLTGEKVMINNSERADVLLTVARTTPLDRVAKKSQGLTIFLVHPQRDRITYSRRDKMGMNYYMTSDVKFKRVSVSENDTLGVVDEGWPLLTDMFNADRIATAAMVVGTGRLALRKAVEYARRRKVFGKPIGANQGIQLPLAEVFVELEAAGVLTNRAAWFLDHGKAAASEAVVALYAAEQAAMKAAERAVQVFGGYGYLREYDVERHFRDLRLFKISPLTQELALAFLGEKALGLPRSY